jgi:hypothetical protein
MDYTPSEQKTLKGLLIFVCVALTVAAVSLAYRSTHPKPYPAARK